MESLELEIHASSYIGRVRNCNEDDFLLLQISRSKFCTKAKGSDKIVIQSQRFEVDENGIILAVSDGCGGAGAGEVASWMAVETVKNLITGEVPNFDASFHQGELIKKLYDSAVYANRAIHTCQRTKRDYNGMGSTLTAVGITPNAVDFLQVGDSRGYLIRKDKIYQITKDQTLIQKLLDEGEVSPEETETHPLKNVILQALGAMNEVYPVAVRLIPQRNDILLLCSDGLSNYLTSDDLLRIIQNNFDDLENACKVLIEEANFAGFDNITGILARLLGEDLPKQTDDSMMVYPLEFEIKNSDV